MGMTIDIDGSIKELSKWRKDLNYDNGDYCYGDDTTRHSLDVAIDTMRKYLKIQEVMDSRPDDDAKSNSKALGEIEVIMYGNDD